MHVQPRGNGPDGRRQRGEPMRHVGYPEPGEYAPYTVEYFDLVPGDDVLGHMLDRLESTPAFFESLRGQDLSIPHRQGEWTVKEILQHISDDERIYAYRALRFARNELTELPGFDQEVVAAHSGANDRSLDDLLDEYASVRAATLTLFRGLPHEALVRVGTANGNPMSVRAAAWHIAGHELHHIASIESNYLGHVVAERPHSSDDASLDQNAIDHTALDHTVQ